MATYDTAGNILSDVAVELGLGAVTDPYGSQDANIVQLRGFLKSAGRKLVFDRDWTHLTREYSFVTYPNWVANTPYVTNASAWAANTAYSVGSYVSSAGNLYQCTTTGISVLSGTGPNTTNSSIADGSCVWKFLNTGSTSIVSHGSGQYINASLTGTSGTAGPIGITVGASEPDGSTAWKYLGPASDYALPSGFSNMIDQTAWNRTSRLPLVGPVDAQTWTYLKGRQQGIVFNVLFRPEAGVFRLYPDTDPPGGYTIAFEYVSSFWVSATGGTAPTTDAPTANSDIIYFDPMLMNRKLKLDWLKNKGFDSSSAKDEYDDVLEIVKNADGSGRVLNLRGPRGGSEPLLSIGNIPQTGIGQ